MNKRKVINNAKWLIMCKTAQSLLQLLIGMMTARYLGPAGYGLINYAKSIVAFVIPFVQLGLDSTLVKEFVDDPEQEGRIIGTSLLMGAVSSFSAMVAVGAFVSVFNRNEPQTILVCVLYSLSLFFQAITLIQYWFHKNLKAKYPAVVQFVVYVLVAAYKIYLLISGKSVYWFALAYSVEFGLFGVSLLFFYRKLSSQKLSWSLSLGRKLISRSHPYIWATLMVTVFQNTDHIMLKMMAGNEENGLYTAAITATAVCQYVYYAIIDSMRPVIVDSKKHNTEEYHKSVSMLYGIITYLGLLQSIGFTILADLIIYVMYGSEYAAAGNILRVLVWYVSFSFMGVVRNVWILAEGKQQCLWKINLGGAVINAAINFALIPHWGAYGAAVASFFTQFLMNFCLGFVYEPIKENNRLLLAGLNPSVIICSLKKEK